MRAVGGRKDMDFRDALIDWDAPDEEGSNAAHIAENGLTRKRWSPLSSMNTRGST
jgi:hypothetical protein